MVLRPSLDQTYMRMLPIYAARSTCARRQVAAIITDQAGRLLGAGFNGVPRGFNHCTETRCPGAEDQPGNNTNCQAVHAEANAILQCQDLDLADIMYCSCTPCFECAKLICNTRIYKVIVAEPYADARGYDLLVKGGHDVIFLANY